MSINNKESIEHFLDNWEKNIKIINDVCDQTFIIRVQNVENEEDILKLIEGLFAIDYVVARIARSLDVESMKDASTFDLTRQHGVMLESHLEALSKHIEKYAVKLGNDDVIFERTGRSVFRFDYKSKQIPESSTSALHQLVLTWDYFRGSLYSVLKAVIVEYWPALAEHVEDKYVFFQSFHTPSYHFYIANELDFTDDGTALVVQLLFDYFKSDRYGLQEKLQEATADNNIYPTEDDINSMVQNFAHDLDMGSSSKRAVMFGYQEGMLKMLEIWKQRL